MSERARELDAEAPFQGGARSEAHYATPGFNDVATLDDGSIWPPSLALTEQNEQQVAVIIRGSIA